MYNDKYHTYSGTSNLNNLDLNFIVPNTGGSSIQMSFILQYYTGTQNGVLIIKVLAMQRFVERFHCSSFFREIHMKCQYVHT